MCIRVRARQIISLIRHLNRLKIMEQYSHVPSFAGGAWLIFCFLAVYQLCAQEYQANVPKPPAQPSQSQDNTEIVSPGKNRAARDPNFPQLELTPAPLDVPDSVRGDGFVRSERLYRRFVLEAFSGYYGSVLSLYDVDDSKGNSNGNTHESEWNNLYNIIVGAQISGNIRRVYYNVWFAMPFNLGLDLIHLHSYEDLENPDTISSRGTFSSKVSYLFLGGLQVGINQVVERKSAQLIIGFGAEGLLGKWDITGGNSSMVKDLGSKKTLDLFAVQVLPFIYLQGGAFITPFLEILGMLGYSPVTLWTMEENRFYGATAQQYRRYGFFGQTVLGEFYFRLWLNRRFALKLGAKGRFTFKTAGNLRTYRINKSGKPLDPKEYDLAVNKAGMQDLQISVFLGLGVALDKNLPPGRKYAMPF